MSNDNHALVIGASGLAGWAVVNQLLLNYPSDGTFNKITALVNRPLKLEGSYWPLDSPNHPEIQLVDGVNLISGSVEDFAENLGRVFPGIESVTHVYYFAYKQESEWETEVAVNSGMMRRVIGALKVHSPKLRFFAFPSGTRGYGIYLPGGMYKAPLVETMNPLPEPYRSQIFYFSFHDILKEESHDKDWTWCDVRPDAIIGFAPHGSTYNLTAHWATYLSLYAYVEGKGAKVPFPGSEAGWACLSNDASATVLARAAIWASLHPEKTSGQIFNIADEAKPRAMKERWMALTKYFGLEGTGPTGDDASIPKPSEYIKKHAHILTEVGIRTQVFQGEFLDTVGYYLDFDRQMSLEKIRKAGFVEEIDCIESWYGAFDQFKKAGMIIK